jgi:uncharacterized protein YdeI (YjbR/CyaY-like superfamily)
MSNKPHQTFETPEQLHAWLRANHAFYATLKRQSQFTVYYRLHSAKRSDNR